MTGYKTIAVVDIGKTNAKLVLIDGGTGGQVAVRSMPNAVRTDGPYPHADVDGLWRFICDGLAGFAREHGVGAISITTHGATGALVAGDRLALPVLDYEHAGPEQMASAYGEVRPAFSESFSPRLPGGLNLGAQIFWQSRAFADDFATVTAILAYPEYWAWRLTGVLASEVTSLGCHTDLWAPRRGDFSSMVDRLGWRRLFPHVRPAASIIGPLDADLAEKLGLSPETPVACGIHDSNASLLPHLDRREAPFTVISTGTWTICMTVGGSTEQLDAGLDSLANVDAFGRPVPTARFMGGREFETLLGAAPVPPDPDDIAEVIATGAMVLPTFAEGVGPFPHGKGRWTDGADALTSGQRTAAASLYLALVTDAALDLCGQGREIVVEGPLARNRLYCAALARLRPVPVRPSGDSTGTSLGAALLLGPIGERAEDLPPISPLDLAGFDAYTATWRRTARA
jgi:sugar (pentulose or hexulose) kinase